MPDATVGNVSTMVEVPLEDEALQEVCRGIMLAELAITDNHQDTLRKISKTMPWHLEAVKLITGSEDQAHQPLETILDEDMNGLVLDCELDVKGITKGGQFLDTQGYIAHNDDAIVVSFRCTTSAFDWLTNFNTTSSAWELEEDAAQGFSGFCSGFDDYCCTGGVYKPRVHTGFYNNFLAALPEIKKHVDPLLQSSQPRKLFVVGHSLGAGIATIAACYFITEYNWATMNHRLVVVTAGSPRSVCTSMKTVIDAKRLEHGDKCHVYRVVNGRDVVTSVPPKLFGFCHIADPIKISDEGLIFLQTKEDDPETDMVELTKYREYEEESRAKELKTVNSTDTADSSSDGTKSKYQRLVSRVPRALRDHMPDFYLKPVLQNLGLKCGSTRRDSESGDHVSDSSSPDPASDRDLESSQKSKRGWMPKVFGSKRKTVPAEPMPSEHTMYM